MAAACSNLGVKAASSRSVALRCSCCGCSPFGGRTRLDKPSGFVMSRWQFTRLRCCGLLPSRLLSWHCVHGLALVVPHHTPQHPWLDEVYKLRLTETLVAVHKAPLRGLVPLRRSCFGCSPYGRSTGRGFQALAYKSWCVSRGCPQGRCLGSPHPSVTHVAVAPTDLTRP